MREIACGRAARGDDPEAEVVQLGGDAQRRRPCRASVTVMNTVPVLRQPRARGRLRLGERGREVAATPITSPVERISGPSSASAPAKRSNGSTASLTDDVVAAVGSARAGRRSASRSPSMTRQASLASGSPVALDTNGTVREARGLASITYRSSP